jgi:hypothetical protein
MVPHAARKQAQDRLPPAMERSMNVYHGEFPCELLSIRRCAVTYLAALLSVTGYTSSLAAYLGITHEARRDRPSALG